MNKPNSPAGRWPATALYPLMALALVALLPWQVAGANPEYTTLEWVDLIPEDDLEALLNPPAYLDEIEDGSIEDMIASQIGNAIALAEDSRYQQALVSTRVIDDHDGRHVRLPGFIVPLEYDDNQRITQFFLVPYFGACIHLPPPPPNQIVLVDYPDGIKLDHIYEPFWVLGQLHTEVNENDLALSAYQMSARILEPYGDD